MTPPRRPAPGRVRAEVLLLLGVGLVWVLTMVRLVAVEIADGRQSEDVRALVDAARLEEAHASARYEIRIGDWRVGELASTVSGGQRADQLAYVLTGRLERPQRVDLHGFVLADWQRRPARFVIEARLDGQRHRVEGGLAPREDGSDDGAVLFEARYVPPAGTDERTVSWVLPDSPVLAPGPLPVPELEGLAGAPGRREGQLADPLTGAPTRWTLDVGETTTFVLAGRPREAVRHVLEYGDERVVVLTEPTGFPLQVDLPLGLRVVLVEEDR